MSNMGQRTPTETLSHRLRLMADAGGNLSRDRKRTCIEAADRLSEFEDIVDKCADKIAMLEDQLRKQAGGGADEEH